MAEVTRFFNFRCLRLKRYFSHPGLTVPGVDKIVIYYLESKEMRFTFMPEIKFESLMDDDPANLLF